MHGELTVSAVAIAAATFTIVSFSTDVAIASRLNGHPSLQALLFTAFALQLMALACIFYFCFLFGKHKKKGTVRAPWVGPNQGAGFNTGALTVTGIAMICYTNKYSDIPSESSYFPAIGLTAWILSLILNAVFFLSLNSRLRKVGKPNVPQVLVTNLGTEHVSQKDLVSDGRTSFYSKDTTSISRSCTPTSSRTYSLHSSTTKVASSLRSKFARHSAKSSLDLATAPTGEASVLGTAFDRYDSSNVDSDVRNTVLGSSPTVNRSGLAPIPGSRPCSPGGTSTKEVILPTSPKFQRQMQNSPESTKSTGVDIPSSPCSSPRNFSRPTSKCKHQPTMSESSHPLPLQPPGLSASMTDLIHPLFRPDSPSHPQILTSGTMVTASPFANQPITPKTLSRLRSSSDLRSKNAPPTPTLSPSTTGQWRVMPPVESPPPSVLRQRSKSVTQRPHTADSTSYDTVIDAPPTKTDTVGSPGPSIVEDDELPPILPGFVLSAGSRTSLVGYGKRKSVKRENAHAL